MLWWEWIWSSDGQRQTKIDCKHKERKMKEITICRKEMARDVDGRVAFQQLTVCSQRLLRWIRLGTRCVARRAADIARIEWRLWHRNQMSLWHRHRRWTPIIRCETIGRTIHAGHRWLMKCFTHVVIDWRSNGHRSMNRLRLQWLHLRNA